MKKLLCFLLSCLLVFNSVSVVYADTNSSFNPYEQFKKNHPDWYDSNGNVIPAGNTFFSKMVVPALIEAGETSGEIVSSLVESVGDFIKSFDNSNGDVSIKYKDNGQPVTENNYNENNFYITYSPKFLNGLNDKLQEKVHALDGYYLLEPIAPFSKADIASYLKENNISNLDDVGSSISYFNSAFDSGATAAVTYPESRFGLNFISSGSGYYYIDSYDIHWQNKDLTDNYHYSSNCYGVRFYYSTLLEKHNYYFTEGTIDYLFSGRSVLFSNSPIKVFYSLDDVINYIKLGKISYVPKLPSTNLTVPLGYANGTLNLPDFNINLDSLIGKAEADIQADIDLALKNYFDSLLEINNNPTKPTNPTPTPDGGFTDGTTPTPTPPITDGGDDSGNDKTDLSKITDLLQKILDKLTEFSSNHDTLAKTITDYIEKNDGKLDEIIVAINALADGKTEEEKNGCKYDFTALSEFMTTLWNESDKKFDKMVELLEENNKYQQKLVNSLNEIKALLVTQTIMDLFKDRSSETANKAKDKFPTSIPWDIALVLNSMSAEPEQLKFSLPIKIDSFKINETIDIDLSSGEWEKLATTCRYILSITFILFLIHLSRKLFSNGGDE